MVSTMAAKCCELTTQRRSSGPGLPWHPSSRMGWRAVGYEDAARSFTGLAAALAGSRRLMDAGQSMRQAVRCSAAGVVLELTAAVCSGSDLISAQQAIALAVPGTLLTVGGLMVSAAVPEEAIAQFGFTAGYLLAALLGICRSALGR
jgi:hypothetical protein